MIRPRSPLVPVIAYLPRWVFLVLGVMWLASGSTQIITEFSAGISTGALPWGITSGSDGNLWFTEAGDLSGFGNRVGRITSSGVVTEFSIGISSFAGLRNITNGPDGNLWFTEVNIGRIGRVTPAGVITEFSGIVTGGGSPEGITAGPDGNLWFVENTGSRVGKITTAGVLTELTTGISPGASPEGITSGPDGNLWFTESGGNRIGRITPAGVVTEFSMGITPSAHPFGITQGPDGNLWFTETGTDRIGRITPAGMVTEFSAGITPGAFLRGIVSGPDGNLWFTESSGNRIGRITPTGVVTEFSAGISPVSGPSDITRGPDDSLWFTETDGHRIGRIVLSRYTVVPSAGPNGAISPATPQIVYDGNTATFTVTPNIGYAATVGGTCAGTLIGTTYTIAPATADCTVVAIFTALSTYSIATTVNPIGAGIINCTPNPVIFGNTATCTAVAASGYALSSISGCGGMAGSVNPYTTGAITSACTVTASFTATPINGVCGSANGTQSLFAPSTNLCSSGTAIAVASTAGEYSWTCIGANGGSTANCASAWANTPSGGKASARAGGASCSSQSGSVSVASNVPSNLSFPEGAVIFTLGGCTAGGTVSMTVQYTNALPAGAQYYKENGTSWLMYPGAVISGNTVTFNITDNGAQDGNPAPGTIMDPSGPAVVVAVPSPTTATAPALSSFALLLLSGLLGGMGWVTRRRSVRS